MSVPLTPAKRSSDRSHTESNGKGKWQKLAGNYSQDQSSKSSDSDATIRVLCPVSKIDGIIGKDGETISQISQEAGVMIRVEEIVPGCDERVVVIAGSYKESEASTEHSKEGGVEETNATEKEDTNLKDSENDADKESVPLADSKSESQTSDLQKALLLVFEKIAAEPETDGGDEENKNSSIFILRLLVLSNQVGCLLGKGGSVIKLMSADSGAQIRVLPRDKLPTCASASDEVVQVSGEIDAVRKALQSVSQQLLKNPPRDHDSFPANLTGQSHPPNHSFGSQGATHALGRRDGTDVHSSNTPLIPKFHESSMPSRLKPLQELLTFRILCHDERVGGVIGKGGSIIKSLQQETGCEIKVLEAVSNTDDRIIVVAGPAHPDDRISPPQDAVLRVQTRIIRAIPDSREQVMARLLVSSNQIGCLLGKGGAIISEMRKLTGAYIRILGKDQIPKCASESEEVVQINGEFEAVQEALLQITTRLRNHFFRDAFPSMNHPLNPTFLDHVPPFPSYVGRREHSPPGMYSNLGPSFPKFDVGGPPRHAGFHPHDDRSLFMHEARRPGLAPHIPERKPWGAQGFIEGGGSIGLPDFAGPPHRRILGFGGGSQPAIITNTTVEVVVPRSLVPIIEGEDGACLKQIRQISDAKITITEPKPGATETVIIISGTPEQTHAAQSLIQAFVMSETEST
ncbi:RNA-binding KH domain-containing protein RCF3-like isoform X1 [Mangifera indica]|uniref:RNA-binding KH domain-containing protein RCF3-like isoform X1 n=1 Tax=Mangifera indica TaxID=29780 RepID=UPI001CF9CF1F|nr:RNA-binding KH domain-containing protein RCF3-like isoform X1 [Mangifera indica]XP_044510999.1 RNA-binding KH domain-containing protein RCF3-like isoform X1 [Mangifera indica]